MSYPLQIQVITHYKDLVLSLNFTKIELFSKNSLCAVGKPKNVKCEIDFTLFQAYPSDYNHHRQYYHH